MTQTASKLLTVHEVAEALRVDDTTVRRWIKSGALPAISLPHRGKRQAYRIAQEILDALLDGTLEALLQDGKFDRLMHVTVERES